MCICLSIFAPDTVEADVEEMGVPPAYCGCIFSEENATAGPALNSPAPRGQLLVRDSASAGKDVGMALVDVRE